MPEEKPRLPKKTGPELDRVRPLKPPVSPSAPTRNVAVNPGAGLGHDRCERGLAYQKKFIKYLGWLFSPRR